ncbi:uncharacterized protein [Rutidosis leptorrhynchoides]|uniref:uncharacterized protein n=1 Tax=Rutidosis leptorrhynchoides TaxID=125765 RepID=UPI003A9A55A8
MAKLITPTSTFIMFCITYAFLWISLCLDHNPPSPGIGIGNPSIDVVPVPINGDTQQSKGAISCGRVPVFGVSRYKLQYYTSVYNVTLTPSVSFLKKWHNRIQVCFHRNSSLGLCKCETDDWRYLQNGIWSVTMSPYEQKYIDVKYDDRVTGSVTASLEEVQQRWRYALLAVGVVLLFFAPVVSEWVPFYYASCMTIGVVVVVLILLYQVRKLLPLGRRKTFYFSIMVSALGAGSVVVHWLSTYINYILLNFGISPEMQNPVYCFAGIGIILLGAAIGYWLLRRYIISNDGEVYDGVVQFVKWSMRIIAVTCILMVSFSGSLPSYLFAVLHR